MATTFFIRTKKTKDTVSLSVRVQDQRKGVNIRQSTPIKVDVEEWLKAAKSRRAMAFYREREPELWKKIDEIKQELDACLSLHPEVELTPERVCKIVDEIANRERYAIERENAKKSQEISFMDYYKRLLDGMRDGTEQGKGGKRFAYRTYSHFNQGYNRLLEYQAYIGKTIDWQDINQDFVKNYTAFLQNVCGYSANTWGTRLKELKFLMKRYADEADKVDTTALMRARDRIEANNAQEVDAIYLTEKELLAFKAADLSALPRGYEYARDLFLVGCYTAQRVSDFNNIKPENIKRREVVRVIDDREIIEERVVIDLRQKKTGTRVIIPVKAELRAILEKYDYQLPKLSDQKINAHIKVIAKIAGIDEPITIRSTKGGKESEEVHPKWELVVSHTARRTGATLMYLSGMQSFDIMRITGHSTPQMLEKYIKADQLEVSEKLVSKYDYFK